MSFYSLCIATMKQTKTIRGDVFTFKKMELLRNGKSSIFDLYKTPWETNRKAFEKREKKLACVYWLCGGSHSYSIYGDIIDENGERHAVKITRQNNYIID